MKSKASDLHTPRVLYSLLGRGVVVLLSGLPADADADVRSADDVAAPKKAVDQPTGRHC